MSSYKWLAATAVSALVFTASAAQAMPLVAPTTSEASLNLGLSLEIEGGTISVITPGIGTETETVTGPGPNSASAAATPSFVSSIDLGCTTPTFGCLVTYDLSASAQSTDGTASGVADISDTTLQVVVDTGTGLTIEVTALDLSGTGVIGDGDMTLSLRIFSISDITVGTDAIFGMGLVAGLSQFIDLAAGTYDLVIGAVSVSATANQVAPSVQVSAPQSLALLSFGLIALGGVRQRRQRAA